MLFLYMFFSLKSQPFLQNKHLLFYYTVNSYFRCKQKNDKRQQTRSLLFGALKNSKVASNVMRQTGKIHIYEGNYLYLWGKTSDRDQTSKNWNKSYFD